MKKSKGESLRDSSARLQRAARERADDQARRIPWQRLHEVRNQYIDWQEFYLWARSILEVENGIPNWLVETLNARCPGFLEIGGALSAKAAKTRPLHLRLEDWIDEHIFSFAKKEGWFNAITYYAIREPRYQRAEVYWSKCGDIWKKVSPGTYIAGEPEFIASIEGCLLIATSELLDRRPFHRPSWQLCPRATVIHPSVDSHL